MANVIDFSIYNCAGCGRRRDSRGCDHCRPGRVSYPAAPRDPRKYFLIASIAIIGAAVSLAGLVFSMGAQ